MTDKEKLDKIIAEIKRLKAYYEMLEEIKPVYDIAIGMADELLEFIDSIQKESKKEAVIEVEKIMAEVDAKFPKFAKEVGDIHSCDPHFGVNIEEESNNVVCWNNMSEKEKSDFLYDLSHMNIEPASEEMKEASCAYARKEIIDPTFPNNEEFEISYSFEEGAKWKAEQFEKERLKQCDTLTKEQAKIESDFVTNFIKKNNRTPTFIDAIEYGMKLKLKDGK